MNEPTNETTNEPSSEKERASEQLWSLECISQIHMQLYLLCVCVCATLVDDIKFNICRDPVIALIK